MTNEERDLIAKFVARVGGAEVGGFARSVPSTVPALPPIDPEADQFIAQQFQAHPEARYRITQMAVVQEAALNEAANRLQALQAEVQRLQQLQQAQGQQQAPSRGGFFGGLFGGGGQQQQAPQPGVWNQGQPQQPYPQQQPGYQPPPPQYAPAAQPGMFQRSGSGFLGSALTTAAGVAGGVVAGNALMDLFSGGHSGGGGGMFGGGGAGFGGAGTLPQETTIINNYGDDAGQALPDPGWDDNTQGQPDDNSGGWDDNSGGGWDDNSSI